MKKNITSLLSASGLFASILTQNVYAQSNTFPASGSVGIGTLSPQQRLHVEGSSNQAIFVNTSALSTISGSGQIGYAKALPTAADQRLGYFLVGSRGGANNNFNTAGMVGYASGAWTAGASHPTHLVFETTPVNATARSERMRIAANGYVGVGVTNPGFLLDVGGRIRLRDGVGGTAGLWLNNTVNSGTVGFIGVYDNNTMGLYGSAFGWSLLMNASNGNVGIGTATPATKLEVVGDLRITGDANFIRFNEGQYIRDAAGSNFEIQTHGDFVPDTDGNHSLGTDANTWFDVWATDPTINTSDARFKKNIVNSPYGLKEILQLRPVTYQWLKGPDDAKRIGLIAQEVQKIIPEMVKDSRIIQDHETGKTTKVPTTRLGLQYDALIPVLVRGMQEQQDQIAQQQQQIADLKEMVNKLIAGQTTNTSFNNATLLQNAPNPVKGSTAIRYSIPESSNRAQLLVTDALGRTVKTLQLGRSGTVNVDASALSGGVYNYSLVIDGKTVETKKMTVAH